MRTVLNLVLLLIVGSSVGCVGVPSAEDMVPAALDITFDARAEMTVLANPGGPGMSIFDDTSLTNELFADAVRLTVERFQLFDDGDGDSDGPHYVLRIGIVEHSVPLVALDMLVTLTTEWVVEDGTSGLELFRDTVTTQGFAAFGAAFAGPVRACMATRNAAESNIQCGFENLRARLAANEAEPLGLRSDSAAP